MLLILSIIVFSVGAIGSGVTGKSASYIYNYLVERYSLFVTFVGTSFFLFVVLKKVRNNRIINQLAKSAFAIFLITENKRIYPYLWNTEILSLNQYFGTAAFEIRALIQVIVISILCILIDQLFRVCFGRPISWVSKCVASITEKHGISISSKMNMMIQKFFS